MTHHGLFSWFRLVARAGAVATLVLMGFLPGTTGLLGQASSQGQQLQPTEELLRRPTAIHPVSGPPGTVVTIRGLHLPAITPVNIGFGGTRSGFEGLAFVLTNTEGIVEEAVEVPDWADHSRIHRFIIFDAYFEPIAMTTLFHVTDERGRIRRAGVVSRLGPTCGQVTGEDGEEYHLLDQPAPLAVGSGVVMEGRVVDSSRCGEGIHLAEVSFPSRE
ncbi:MAG: hypothetical protein WEA09_13840 [Gemmatimonadota bacterium]